MKPFVKQILKKHAKRISAERKGFFFRLWSAVEPYVAKGHSRKRVSSLRKRLLSYGFHECASADLLRLVENHPRTDKGRAAAWELVNFYLDQRDTSHTAQLQHCLQVVGQAAKKSDAKRQFAIAASEAHCLLGQEALAKAVLQAELQREEHIDILLALANFERNPSEKIGLINRALGLQGLAAVVLEDNDSVPTYDRLRVGQPLTAASDQPAPLVSIIMPVHNGEKTVLTALTAIINQTWKNIECIVVDDCSTDGTRTVLEKLAAIDSRVTILSLAENSGTYVARNAGLSAAGGDYITCHDADDWSHPRKIELQVKRIMRNRQCMATMSSQARATDRLDFVRRGRPGAIAFENLSSLMFRREVLSELGYWDSVRFGADGEFLRRLKKKFGEDSIIELPELLSFQRFSGSSLTGSQKFGYNGFLAGARLAYYNASAEYHKTASSLKYSYPMDHRPFPVPSPMLPKQAAPMTPRHYDVVIGSDFRLAGGSTLSSIEEIKAQHEAGLRTAIFQICRYDYDAFANISPKVMDLVERGYADLLVYGETVTCDLLIVRYPPVLHQFQRYLPTVNAQEVKIIVNQPPMSDYGPDGVVRYNIPQCVEHARSYFGTSGIWYPIAPMVREALVKHHADWLSSATISNEDWLNIVDLREWRRSSNHQVSNPPRIGRHSRDHEMKWPDDRQTLLSIYPARRDVEVWVLGGANIPSKIIGYLPSNWHVFPFDGLPVREFLAKIDVFVYYTHDAWIESFGRVVIEAMATGVPVVLPFSYKVLFEDAALYAEPKDVQSVVQSLVSNPDFYRSQIERAIGFVERKFGYSMHVDRVRAVKARTQAAGRIESHA